MSTSSPNHASSPNALVAYTVTVLRHQDTYLLLQRAATKRIWPNLWTGVGGRVEEHEYVDLCQSALRELAEETGIISADVTQFALRRVLLHARPQMPLTLLLYFTGTLRQKVLPPCSEGTLAWVTAADLPKLAIIGSTRPVLPLLLDDCVRDPDGSESIRLGIASFKADGEVDRLAWVDAQ